MSCPRKKFTFDKHFTRLIGVILQPSSEKNPDWVKEMTFNSTNSNLTYLTVDFNYNTNADFKCRPLHNQRFQIASIEVVE